MVWEWVARNWPGLTISLAGGILVLSLIFMCQAQKASGQLPPHPGEDERRD